MENILSQELPTDCKQAAHWWYAFGFNVAPMEAKEKHTRLKWGPWLARLSKEGHSAIEDEFKPGDEVCAIVDDKFFILDADSPLAVAALQGLEEAFEVHPNLIVKTSHGEHHYFRKAAGSYASMAGHSTKEHPERLDIRTARGAEEGRSVIVLPPSPGRTIVINEADDASDLVEVGQEFIDAVFRHNGQEPPRAGDPNQPPPVRGPLKANEVSEILSYISPGCGYSDWFSILAGVHHRFAGSMEGFEIADAWSAEADNYCGREELEYKWRSLESDRHGKRVATFATVARMAGLAGADLAAIANTYGHEQQASQPQMEPPPVVPSEAVFSLPDYPADLMALPYKLGELQQFIYNRMTYQSLPMAGITALATLTAFAQTHITIKSRDGLGFNEYYMILAPTGFGKEDIRKPMEILDRKSEDAIKAGMGNLESVKIRHAAPASAQGIHQILEENRSTCFLSDEFAEWLRMSHSDAQKQAGLGYLMQAYTKALGIIEPGHAVTRKYDPVENPRLSIFATSTAEAMFSTLTRDQADSGAYNRWVMFPGDNELPEKRYTGQVYQPDQTLINFIAWVKEIQPRKEISFSAEGFRAFIELDSSMAEPIKRRDGVLGGRLSEQAIKMAGLIALSDKRFHIEPSDLRAAFNIRIGLYQRAAALARHEGSLDGLHSTGQAMKQLAEQFEKRPSIYRSQLKSLSRRYAALSVTEQRAVVDALVSEGVVEIDPARRAVLVSKVCAQDSPKV